MLVEMWMDARRTPATSMGAGVAASD